MDQMTQQNAAMVEETSAASQTLAHEGEELARLISRFKLGASAGRRSQGAPRQPVGTARPSTPAPQKIVRASSGGRAAVAVAASAPDSWEEF
jgi:methyl-accepting chemotaxis protein